MKYKCGDIVEVDAPPDGWPDVVYYNGMRGVVKYVDRIRGVYIVQILSEYHHEIDASAGWQINNVYIPEWCAKKVLAPARKLPIVRVE